MLSDLWRWSSNFTRVRNAGPVGWDNSITSYESQSIASTNEPTPNDAQLSSALVRCFRGKLCDTILSETAPIKFEKGANLYDVGDENRTFFFIRDGVVKIGCVTAEGHELIYDLRKAGEVVGELCVHRTVRCDRAVALELTHAVVVPYDRILESLRTNGPALRQFLEAICATLSDAYEHVDVLSTRDSIGRLIKVLLKLADEFGRPGAEGVEITTYLTQEEIAQMAAVSREKISVSLNRLRARHLVNYSRGGRLLLNVEALKAYRE